MALAFANLVPDETAFGVQHHGECTPVAALLAGVQGLQHKGNLSHLSCWYLNCWSFSLFMVLPSLVPPLHMEGLTGAAPGVQSLKQVGQY